MNEQIQKIEKNSSIVENLLLKVDEERRLALQNLLSVLKDRIIVTPYSSKTEYVGCYPGGLVDVSLKIVNNMAKLSKFYETSVTSSSIIIVGLFHDLGKVGSLTESYYTEQTSDWHKKQGNLFEVNKNLVHMNVSQRTLWLLQHFKVQLTEEEFFAISSNKDKSRGEEIQSYSFNEPWISLLLQHSLKAFFLQERTKSNILLK